MASLSYCGDQVKRFDYDRFICILFAPPDEREALFAVHAFNAEVARIPEVVSQPTLGQMRLQWWSEALDGIYGGRPPKHQVATSLAAAVARFGLTRQHFERLLDGRGFDLEEGAPADTAALLDYAEATSASLSLLSLEILGDAGPQAQTAARDVGIAWALTGLIRAVPFHARARRTYLPASLNREAGLDVFALFERGSVPGLAAVVRTLAATAQTHLEAARSAAGEIPNRAVPALLPATMAAHYLGRLRRANYDPFAMPVRKAGPAVLARVAINAARGCY